MKPAVLYSSSLPVLLPFSTKHQSKGSDRCKTSSISRKIWALKRDGNEYDRDYDGKLIDENMIVLRMRIHEMKMREDDRLTAPANWMEWEKQYYHGNYSSDVCEAVGILQASFMNTRPSLALGVAVPVVMSLPTSIAVIMSSLLQFN